MTSENLEKRNLSPDQSVTENEIATNIESTSFTCNNTSSAYKPMTIFRYLETGNPLTTLFAGRNHGISNSATRDMGLHKQREHVPAIWINKVDLNLIITKYLIQPQNQ